MKFTFRKAETFVIIVIIAAIGIIYAFTQKPALAPTQGNTNVASLNQTVQTKSADQTAKSANPTDALMQAIRYSGEDGRNALDLLEAGHRVGLKNYTFGDMVNSIDGVEPDAQHFWAFYINGSLAQVGAGSFITKSTDVIEWKLDEIKNF
jgi:hypothetical protein